MLSTIRTKRDEEGFTLIELLVVVIIIGILAAIAIPVFLNQRENAWRSSVESDIRNAAMAVESFYTRESAYPESTVDGSPWTEGPIYIGADGKVLTQAEESTEAPEGTVATITVSEGVSLEFTADDTVFTFTGTHGSLDEEISYDSTQGGLQEWTATSGG